MTDNWKKQPDSTHIRSIQWDSSWPELAGANDRSYVFSYIERRFGIPEDEFREFLLFKKKRSYWMLRESSHLIHASQLKIKIIGMKVFQDVGAYIKPTTRFIQLFGHAANRAILKLDEEDLKDLVAGNYMPVDMDIDNGYVILSYKGHALGLGLLINGSVRSQIPQKGLLFSSNDKKGEIT